MVTKERLYAGVRLLKYRQYGNPDCYGMDNILFVVNRGLQVKALPFKTKGLRGMAVPGGENERDIILLNQYRSDVEKNVDCAHEMMHLSFHSDIRRKTFSCFDRIVANQDAFIEWQANEGAAEYCVPYRAFIPMVCEDFMAIRTYNITLFQDYCAQLGHVFNVTPTVIDYRMRNLRWEIYQYLCGADMDEIELLSNRQLVRRDVHIKSIPDLVIENQQREDAELMSLRTRP